MEDEASRSVLCSYDAKSAVVLLYERYEEVGHWQRCNLRSRIDATLRLLITWSLKDLAKPNRLAKSLSGIRYRASATASQRQQSVRACELLGHGHEHRDHLGIVQKYL